MTKHHGDPTVETIRGELARVLSAAAFDASDRNRCFLRYVVEETVSGRAGRIKAYAIATSVFGRGPDFDPQVDSIVRIEAGRLRRSLERYYLTAGAADPLWIMIPKGSYIPSFQVPDAAGAVPVPGARRPGPVVRVLPFEPEGDQSAFVNFTAVFNRLLVVGLTRFGDLAVYGPDPAPQAGSGGPPPAPDRPAPDFLVSGGTTFTGSTFGVEVLLTEARTGRCLWAETFERRLDPPSAPAARDAVANRIARILGQPFGVLFTCRAREVDLRLPEAFSADDCVIRFHQDQRSGDADPGATRAGLEAALAREPDHADAHACLSRACSDACGRRGGPDPASLREGALKHARRAVELAPRSSRCHHALGLAHWVWGDVAASLAALETGLALNPNDTQLMAELGLRHAMQMDWDRALPLIAEAYLCNPGLPRSYRIGLALNHYAEGRPREAIAEARETAAPRLVLGPLLVAAASIRLGRLAASSAAVDKVLRIDPAYGGQMAEDLEGRNLHPRLAAAILADVARAGLGGPSPAGVAADPRPARTAATWAAGPDLVLAGREQTMHAP